MKLEQLKRTTAAAWIVAAGLTGLAANVSSIPAAIILAVAGFGPPLVMLLVWNNPPQTPLTETIRQRRQ